MNSTEKIKSFYELKKDWNDNGADPIESEIITNALFLDEKIPIKTDVFPTARHSIQFEFEKNGYYLEFELMRSDNVTMFKIVKNKETTELFKLDKAGLEKILSEIEKFRQY